MASITFKERSYDLTLNNYTMYNYGKSVGVKTPIEAINTLSELKEGYTFEGQEKLSKFVHYCTKGAISIEDCFELINDVDVLGIVMSEIETYVSAIIPLNEVTEKKKSQPIA